MEIDIKGKDLIDTDTNITLFKSHFQLFNIFRNCLLILDTLNFPALIKIFTAYFKYLQLYTVVKLKCLELTIECTIQL